MSGLVLRLLAPVADAIDQRTIRKPSINVGEGRCRRSIDDGAANR
jgi:hypothetical protein